MAGEPAATLDSEETLRAAKTLQAAKRLKDMVTLEPPRQPHTAFSCKITSGLLTHVHPQSHPHRPSPALSVLLGKGLPTSYAKSRNPIRKFQVLRNSTSHYRAVPTNLTGSQQGPDCRERGQRDG